MKFFNSIFLKVSALSILILAILPATSFAEDLLPPACTAASNAVNYGNVVTVPDDLRALIDFYRSDWRDFCNPKSGKIITLAELDATGSIRGLKEHGTTAGAIRLGRLTLPANCAGLPG
jgi:hypothetical protein